MDRLREIETFIRIVERGSLTGAADALNVSLPTVVRLLATVEKRLGARLLQRTTRRIALTDEGREFYERGRRIVAEVEESEANLGAAAPRGLLRITAPVLFGRLHVQPLVHEFMRKYPEVTVEFLMSDPYVDLVEQGMDLGVRIGQLPDSSLVAFPVGEVRLVLCASPRYLAKAGTPAHPRDLARHTCVRFTGFSRFREWTFHKNGELIKVSIAGSLRCNFGENLIEAYQVWAFVAARRLRLLLDDYAPPVWPVNVLVPSAQLLPARTRLMVEWLRRRLPPRIAAVRI
jgi:DNA-binding transcriptional LysR family regulator